MRAVIFYATREGQTRRIAFRIADGLRLHGVDADVFDVRSGTPSDWSHYASACVAASVHRGHHEPEMIAFVTAHRAELEKLDASFVSVTLSEAGVEDPKRTEEARRRAADDVQRMFDVFVADTGWRPSRMVPVAGALSYTKYNILVRFLMKRIARKEGAPTDTSRDHELTDWTAVDRFAAQLAEHTR